MIQERTDTTVFRGVFKGHELIIREMVWDKELSTIAPILAKNYYCGYVELLPEGKRFVGFDTVHAFQPQFSLDTVKQDCFDLIDQIIAKNGEMKWN